MAAGIRSVEPQAVQVAADNSRVVTRQVSASGSVSDTRSNPVKAQIVTAVFTCPDIIGAMVPE